MKGLAKNIRAVARVIACAAILSNSSQAGELANEAQQKCLELTRIAADSMKLTREDEGWCEAWGHAVEDRPAGNVFRQSDLASRPSRLSHAELVALTTRYMKQQSPLLADFPLAAKTMWAFGAMLRGEMR
jgi:hypothetical protein